MRRCHHVWNVIAQVEQPSALDKLLAGGATKMQGLQSRDLVSYVIVTRECLTCGTQEVQRV